MPDLFAVQTSFANVLRRQADESVALSLLVGDDARNRDLLAVYRGNAVSNAHKAMTLHFPVVSKIVGGEFFEGLARAYWTAHPSQSGDLNEYGEHFSDFLATFGHVSDLPYLTDVARLEWYVAQAGMAADHVAIHAASLAMIAPAALGGVVLGLQPALEVMRSSWPIASIWLQHQPAYAAAIDIDLGCAECCAVYRDGLHAEVMSLTEAEASFWVTALRGGTLEAMLGHAFEEDAGFDVQGCLQRGFAAGFIISIREE